MKKTLILFTSIVCTAALMVGCSNTAMPSVVGEKLEYSLNSLYYTVKNLDSIDNLYLANPDISPVINSSDNLMSLTTTPRQGIGKNLVSGLTLSVGGFISPITNDSSEVSNTQTSNLISEKLINSEDNHLLNKTPRTRNTTQQIQTVEDSRTSDRTRLNQNNTETKVVKENNDNINSNPRVNRRIANQFINNGNNKIAEITETDSNNTENRQTNVAFENRVSNKNLNGERPVNNDTGNITANSVNNATNTNAEETVNNSRVETNTNLDNNVNKITNEVETSVNQNIENVNQNTTDLTDNINNNLTETRDNNIEKEAGYNTTAETRDIEMEENRTNYQPRYLSPNTQTDNEHLTNYINKINSLYSMTNDAVEANNTLTYCKENLYSCINELRDLAILMKNGNYKPQSQQITAINNYINDIKTTISRIRSTNGQLNNEVNKINNFDKEGLTTSIDVLSSNYLRILNHIDVRITYLKNALATLEQVKSLLEEAQTSNVTDEEIVLQSRQENNLVDNNRKLTDNNVLDNEKELIQPATDNRNIADTITDTAQTETNRSIITQDNVNNNRLNRNNVSNQTTTERERTNTNTTQTRNSTNNRNATRIIAENESDRMRNVDTYSRANTEESNNIYDKTRDRRNIDTFNQRRIRSNVNNTTNNTNTNTNINNDSNINNNINHNVTTPNNTNQTVVNDNVNTDTNNLNNNAVNNGVNNNVVNNGMNNGVNGGINNGLNNGGLNNGLNNGINNTGINPQNSNAVNTPNGTFQNGIITQNNLNQGVNNGVNGNTTGFSGSRNNPYVANPNGRNTNVDTYGYNTMIDMINRGTVNNGINTLSASAPEALTNMKPNMVNSEIEENVNSQLPAEKVVQRIIA